MTPGDLGSARHSRSAISRIRRREAAAAARTDRRRVHLPRVRRSHHHLRRAIEAAGLRLPARDRARPAHHPGAGGLHGRPRGDGADRARGRVRLDHPQLARAGRASSVAASAASQVAAGDPHGRSARSHGSRRPARGRRPRRRHHRRHRPQGADARRPRVAARRGCARSTARTSTSTGCAGSAPTGRRTPAGGPWPTPRASGVTAGTASPADDVLTAALGPRRVTAPAAGGRRRA